MGNDEQQQIMLNVDMAIVRFLFSYSRFGTVGQMTRGVYHRRITSSL
jgi:hypothetical protein